MPARFFFSDNFPYFLNMGIIRPGVDTLKVALCSNGIPDYSAWQASTVYSVGDIVIPTTRNGHRYVCTVSGSSGSTEPTWPTDTSETVTDNAATWAEHGGEFCNNDELGEFSEVEAGSGYTAGGNEISGAAVYGGGVVSRFDHEDPAWTALTKSFRFAVWYKPETGGDFDDPVIGYCLLDDTPADVVVNGVDFALNLNSSGLYQITTQQG